MVNKVTNNNMVGGHCSENIGHNRYIGEQVVVWRAHNIVDSQCNVWCQVGKPFKSTSGGGMKSTLTLCPIFFSTMRDAFGQYV